METCAHCGEEFGWLYQIPQSGEQEAFWLCEACLIKLERTRAAEPKPHIMLDTDELALCHWCKGPIAGESPKIVYGVGGVNYVRVYHPNCWEDQEIPF